MPKVIFYLLKGDYNPEKTCNFMGYAHQLGGDDY